MTPNIKLTISCDGKEYLAHLPGVPRVGETVAIKFPQIGEHQFKVTKVLWINTEAAGTDVSKVVLYAEEL